MIGLSTPVSARRQHDVVGHVDPAAGEVVVPVDAPQVARRRGRACRRRRPRSRSMRRRVGQLGERRQRDALLAEAVDAVGQRVVVDDPVGQAELVLEGVDGRFGSASCLYILSKPSGAIRAFDAYRLCKADASEIRACVDRIRRRGRAVRHQAPHRRTVEARRVGNGDGPGRRVRAHRHRRCASTSTRSRPPAWSRARWPSRRPRASAVHWQLAPAAAAAFPDRHGELSVDLIASVRSTLGEEALDRVIVAHGPTDRPPATELALAGAADRRRTRAAPWPTSAPTRGTSPRSRRRRRRRSR